MEFSSPESETFYLEGIKKYVREHKYSEALDLFERAVEAELGNEKLRYAVSRYFIIENQPDRILKLHQRAMKLGESNKNIYAKRLLWFLNVMTERQ